MDSIMNVFKALVVSEISEKKFESAIVERNVKDLPEGDVLIRVHYSSLNYKDALVANGAPGITREYPHTPGIDAAGVIEVSDTDKFTVGDEVIVTGYDLGMNTAGGYGQYIRVPSAWVIKKPQNLSLKESMILGTAGFTAALSIEKLLHMGLSQAGAKVLVTGASGGVGSVAIALLHKLGFEVTASTGKLDADDFLKRLGAAEVIDRALLSESNRKPLLKPQWDAAVDSVGGDTLANILKSIRYGGSVSCCGLVQSINVPTSVMPFLLRNINLLGIDSVELPLSDKQKAWDKLAGEWKLENLESLATEITLAEIPGQLSAIYRGENIGRIVVNLDK